MTGPLEIAVDDPRAADVRQLIDQHLAFARRHSPPEDVHALDADGLLGPDVVLFSVRQAGELLAIGALKALGDGEAEVKSMHTAAPARGQGIGRVMLEHLIGVARSRGYDALLLETGSMAAFAPARSLYDQAGFRACPPFGDYQAGPNSTCLRLAL